MIGKQTTIRRILQAPTYPVPANEKVLKSEHLRGLALFAIRQAGLATSDGAYGFFCPAQRQRSDYNIVSFERGEVRVEGLAVLGRDGIAVIGEPGVLQVKEDRSFTLVARWTLPQYAPDDGPVPAVVTLAREGDPGDFDVEVEVARITPRGNPSVLLRAPLLSIEATRDSAAAARALRANLANLAPLVETTSRQHPGMRALVGAEMRSAAQSIDPDPLSVLERVAAILRTCAAMVRLEDGAGAELTTGFERLSSRHAVAEDGIATASAWIAWVNDAASLIDLQGEFAGWLRGAHGEVPLSGEPENHSDRIYRFTYALAGINAQTLRLIVSGDADMRGQVQFRLDGGEIRNAVVVAGADGFEARIIPGTARLIEILAPLPVKPVLLY